MSSITRTGPLRLWRHSITKVITTQVSLIRNMYGLYQGCALNLTALEISKYFHSSLRFQHFVVIMLCSYMVHAMSANLPDNTWLAKQTTYYLTQFVFFFFYRKFDFRNRQGLRIFIGNKFCNLDYLNGKSPKIAHC